MKEGDNGWPLLVVDQMAGLDSNKVNAVAPSDWSLDHVMQVITDKVLDRGKVIYETKKVKPAENSEENQSDKLDFKISKATLEEFNEHFLKQLKLHLNEGDGKEKQLQYFIQQIQPERCITNHSSEVLGSPLKLCTGHPEKVMYILVEAACFFSVKEKWKKKAGLRYSKDHSKRKDKCLELIENLLERANESPHELFGDYTNLNPLENIGTQPLALALHYKLGQIFSHCTVHDVLGEVWYGELESLKSQVCFDMEHPLKMKFSSKVHRSLYREVPILFALTEALFWALSLAMTYWILWKENREDGWFGNGAEKTFDYRHLMLIILVLGFLLHELVKLSRHGLSEYCNNSVWILLDIAIWLCFGAWMYYKLFHINDENACYILSMNSLFMLFRCLRYIAIYTDQKLIASFFKMVKDVAQFVHFYFLFLWGFSIVMNSVFQEIEQFRDPYATLLTLFSSTLGEFDFDWFVDHPARHFGEVLLCLFLIVNSILLFNMLIAILTKTYEETQTNGKHHHMWSWGMAKFLKDSQMAHNQKDYWTLDYLPPPFTFFYLLPLPKCLRKMVYAVIDIFCSLLILFPLFLILDLGVYAVWLQFQFFKKWERCSYNMSLLGLCGKALALALYQIVGSLILILGFLVFYPPCFIVNVMANQARGLTRDNTALAELEDHSRNSQGTKNVQSATGEELVAASAQKPEPAVEKLGNPEGSLKSQETEMEANECGSGASSDIGEEGLAQSLESDTAFKNLENTAGKNVQGESLLAPSPNKLILPKISEKRTQPAI